jgi:L-amino acid N-acyltransferase YncA
VTAMDYAVRAATAADAAAICEIYNRGIEDRLATLETELRTPDERRQEQGLLGGTWVDTIIMERLL